MEQKIDQEVWMDIGSAEELKKLEVQQIQLGGTRIAVTYRDGVFGAIHGSCNHAGGPLGKGHLDGDYVVCPWHQWKFHRLEGQGERGFEEDVVPAYHVRVRESRVEVNITPFKKRTKKPHELHPLSREIIREAGVPRIVGISTTIMNPDYPRFSTSEFLLEKAIQHAQSKNHPTQMIRLRDLSFKPCEGYYSKAAKACTWPCSITQMDPQDQLDQVYEALVHWGDVFIISTSIRWGAPSSLYFKMVERMNCIQNQITISGRMLLQNKVVGTIITGGQDNVQGVAGQMLGFFAELGCQFPQFPYVAHSRGWSAEDMERNIQMVQSSELLVQGSTELVDRSIDLATRLIASTPAPVPRGGRKGKSF